MVKAPGNIPASTFYEGFFLRSLVSLVSPQAGGHGQNESGICCLERETQGEKERLGVWISDTEGARDWLSNIVIVSREGVYGHLLGDAVDFQPCSHLCTDEAQI